ncbi:MAG TPA: glycosyltransferase [Ignavibacteriaceae bacterium]|nr:glycosyltransferase [Ignavibacteriaceae bacterium]
MEKRKKIIIIGPAYPYRGGNSLFISHLYEALEKHFNVKVFNYKLLYPSILFPGTTQYDQSNTVIKKAPNERKVNSINPFNWIKVANDIIEENPDLVVFDWWHPFFGPVHFGISSLIKKKLGNKIFFITENVVSHEANIVDRTLTKLGLANSSGFLTLSEKVESEVKEFAKNKPIYLSELPIYDCYISESNKEFNKEKFGFSPDNKVVLFFGYIRKYKGLDLLIKAMPMLLEKYPEMRLLVVGESYDNPVTYNSIIKELKLDDKVVFINKFVPNEDVEEYYAVSDLVVLPYRSATQSGILNVAYGFLKPVVVTNVGGLTEFVDEGKTGVIVEPESSEKIAEGIIRFFDTYKNVNFSENISNKIKNNKFFDIHNLFKKIIEDR